MQLAATHRGASTMRGTYLHKTYSTTALPSTVTSSGYQGETCTVHKFVTPPYTQHIQAPAKKKGSASPLRVSPHLVRRVPAVKQLQHDHAHEKHGPRDDPRPLRSEGSRAHTRGEGHTKTHALSATRPFIRRGRTRLAAHTQGRSIQPNGKDIDNMSFSSANSFAVGEQCHKWMRMPPPWWRGGGGCTKD